MSMVTPDINSIVITSIGTAYLLSLTILLVAWQELKSAIKTGYVHYLMGLIFGITTIITVNTSVIFLYLANALNTASMFTVVIMAVGMSIPNSYYLSRVVIKSTGITESTLPEKSTSS